MSTRITVYGAALTPYTIKVVRALRWKGLAHELVEPASAEDFRRWSPENGLLPVIDLGGTRVQDSSKILDLLEARFPEPPLLSRDPKVAREQRRLEQWVGETFFFHLLRWLRSRFADLVEPREGQALGPLMRLGLIGSDGRVRPEVFETGQSGPGPEFEGSLLELGKLLGARRFFFADELSRADLAVFAALQGLAADRYPGGAVLLRTHPTLQRHSEHVDAATRARAAA